MSGDHLLRSYAHLDSPVHRAPAPLKVLVTLVVVVVVAVVPVASAAWTALLLPLLLLVARAARVPLSSFLLRLAALQPFVLGVALLALLQGRGLSVFASVALKSTVSVGLVQLLAHTTPFPDLLQVLGRCHAPRALIATMALLHRYLHHLLDESLRMRRARAARTWDTRRWTAWRAASSIIATSFARSVARSERVAMAMRARGAA